MVTVGERLLFTAENVGAVVDRSNGDSMTVYSIKTFYLYL